MTSMDTSFLDRREQDFFRAVTEWHGDQKRKFTGDPYVLHLLAVARRIKEHTANPKLVAAALGHDLLEDTTCTLEDLASDLITSGYSPDEQKQISKWILELTDEFVREKYPRMNRKMRKEKETARLKEVSVGAQTVKYADLIDNAMDLALHDTDFSIVFQREMEQLLEGMHRGDSQLYDQAKLVLNRLKRERMPGSSGAIVHAYLKALGNSDIDALLELFSEDAVVFSPRYGQQSVKDFFTQLFADTEKSELRLFQFFDAPGDEIAAYFHYDWTLKTGELISFDVCDIFTLNQKREIRELRIIYSLTNN